MSDSTSEQVLDLFFTQANSIQYAFKDGHLALFQNGIYSTCDPDEVAELDYEIKKNHPHIFRDPQRLQATKEELKPDYALREQIRKEERAKLLAEIAGGRDMGNSTLKGGEGTGIATTANVGQAAVGASEGGIVSAARVINVPKAVATQTAGPSA